jgi:hypothetical protein
VRRLIQVLFSARNAARDWTPSLRPWPKLRSRCASNRLQTRIQDQKRSRTGQFNLLHLLQLKRRQPLRSPNSRLNTSKSNPLRKLLRLFTPRPAIIRRHNPEEALSA